MKFSEIKTKKISELHRLLADFRDKLREIRFKAVSGQFKNVREIRKTKKMIARILTLLNTKTTKS